MDIKELGKKQSSLDSKIFERAGIKEYPYIKSELALLTEIGELANEVQSFKYWKQNKKIDREKVLEEWADCFHFALSLENQLNQVGKKTIDSTVGVPKLKENDIDVIFIEAYKNIVEGKEILITIVSLGIQLNFSIEEMEQAYSKKYQKNIRRQLEGY